MDKQLLVGVLSRYVDQHHVDGVGNMKVGYLYLIKGSKHTFLLRAYPSGENVAMVVPEEEEEEEEVTKDGEEEDMIN